MIPTFLSTLFLVNVWQSVRYRSLEGEIDSLVETQERIVDLQKKMIRDVGILESPERIQDSIEEEGLKLLEMENMLVLELQKGGE